jgi:cell division transport system permease protein
LLESYVEDNPFPASYFVTLTDLSLNEEVQSQIKQLDFVDDINSRNDTISNLEKLAKGIRFTSFVLLFLLVVISLFIISYTIKLTVHARRREISIMKYVGGTNNFIRGPFIVEGIVIGIISSLVSLLILGIIYRFGLGKVVESSVFSFMTITLYSFNDIFGKILGVYLLLGIGMGVIGSTISMKRYLDV